MEVNRTYSAQWPNMTRKGEAPADADEYKGVSGKFEQFFSASPHKKD
jgi:ferredoxin